MAIDFSDIFTDTNGTSLPTHDSEWTERNIGTDIQNNRAEFSSITNTGEASACHIQSATLTDSNYYVQCTFNTGTFGNEFHGLVARRSNGGTADNNGYFMFPLQDSNVYQIYKRVAESWTQLGSDVSVTLADSTDYTIKMVVDTGAASEVVCTLDGANEGARSDTAITAKNDCGLGLGTGQSASDDCQWDDFECGTLTEPAAGTNTIIIVPTGPPLS